MMLFGALAGVNVAEGWNMPAPVLFFEAPNFWLVVTAGLFESFSA
jgi:hypothetical protein